MIKYFRGKYYFLSNFSDSNISINGTTFLNGEAAFQSFKDLEKQKEFSQLTPSEAKEKGRKVKLRSDWESIKNYIMYSVVKAKFEQNEDLKNKLLNTGEEILQEGNTWGDYYWGVCRGSGSNKLGKILMQVRDELR